MEMYGAMIGSLLDQIAPGETVCTQEDNPDTHKEIESEAQEVQVV